MGLGKLSEAEKMGLVAECGLVLGYARFCSEPVQTGRRSGRDRVCVSMMRVVVDWVFGKPPACGGSTLGSVLVKSVNSQVC